MSDKYSYLVQVSNYKDAPFKDAYTALTYYVYAEGLTTFKILDGKEELASISCSGDLKARKRALEYLVKELKTAGINLDVWFEVFM